jgi:hypothetical protein
MRILGAILVLLGSGAVVWAVPASYRLPRPKDLGAAALAPVALALAILGGVLIAVPGFLG